MFVRLKIASVVLGLMVMGGHPFAQHGLPRVRKNAVPPKEQAASKNQSLEEKKEARQGENVAQKHLGDWLRRYKDLPPDQQRKALESDPVFQKLPPHRQVQLLQRLQHFSNLPPKQQARILSRMETWEHLTSEQKKQRNQINRAVHDLPADRRQAVIRAIRGMRDMTPEQREQSLNSDEFKAEFTDHERDLLRGAASLPLAPSEANSQ